MRCAIYARFSSDRQNAHSAEDQARLCRERADREGWTVVDVHQDIAISGAVRQRPGMTALLAQVEARAYDVVLAEDISRLGRNLGDLDRLYERFAYAGVRIVTLADGEVGDLHIGLKGTMAKLERKGLAARVQRGQLGAVERGRIPGGILYGYDKANVLHPDGRFERGMRTINEEQAAVVRRIFAEVIAGRSTIAIARDLNLDGILAPRGGEWGAHNIAGSAGRSSGVLNNPIYVGRYAYRRTRTAYHPVTRKKELHARPEGEWVWSDMPQLAIVDQATWEAAQQVRRRSRGQPLHRRRKPRWLLAGLVHCAACGHQATLRGGYVCCHRARDKGTCDSRRGIRPQDLIDRVFAGLREQLLAPDQVSSLVAKYHRHRAVVVAEGAQARTRVEARLAAVERAISRLIAAVEAGDVDVPELVDALSARRAERETLQSELAELAAPAVIAMYPGIADAYRLHIAQLTDRAETSADSATGRALRALIERIEIAPAAGRRGALVEVTGSLQAVLDMANATAPKSVAQPKVGSRLRFIER